MLPEETSVPKPLKISSSLEVINSKQFPDTGVREALSSSGMYKKNAVRRFDQPSMLHFPNPRSLSRCHSAPYLQPNFDRMASVLKLGKLQELLFHRVLHDVDSPSRILGKSKSAKDGDDVMIAGGVCISEVLNCDWLRKTAWRDYLHLFRTQLDPNRTAGDLIRPVGEGVCDRLAKDDSG